MTSGSGSETTTTKPGRFRWWIPGAVAAILIVATAGMFFLRGGRDMEPLSKDATGLDPRLVAVAPFENRTGSADLDNLGLVTADWLTNTLARIDAIDVVPIGLGVESRSGVTSPLEVADATGAGIVVTGSYFLEAESLRFQANLDGDRQRALAKMRRNFELAPRSSLVRFGESEYGLSHQKE